MAYKVNSKKAPAAEKSIEQRRIDYLRKAIREKYDYTKVDSELRKNGFRELYVRNPVECVLKYCFKYNDKNPQKRKGLREFNELWRTLLEDSRIEYIPVNRTNGKNDVSYITLHDLRMYILNASAQYDKSLGTQAKTMKKTVSIDKELERLNFDVQKSDEEFFKFYHKYSLDMSETRSTLRYYFIKYVYFLICFQILDFIEILKKFSGVLPEDFIKELYDCPPAANWWSIEVGIYKDEKTGILYETGYDDNWQPAKIVLAAALKHLPLWRSDYLKKAEEVSPLLLTKSGKKIPISKIADKTMIFPLKKNETNTKELIFTEGHNKLAEAIKRLAIKDFEGFPIDFKKLYHMVFEKIISKGETWDTYLKKNNDIVNDGRRLYTSLKKDDTEFMIGIIDGKYDLSRSALLMFLASVRGAIRDDHMLKEAEYSLYDVSCFLDLTRVNEILSSSGYLRLPDNVKTKVESRVDKMYKKVFSHKNREGQQTAADILCDEMGDFYDEHNYSFLPFDVAEIPSEKIGKKIIGRG